MCKYIYIYIYEVFGVTAVVPGEPLPGCTTVTVWANRWRVLVSLIAGQFLVANVLLQAGTGLSARAGPTLAAAAATAAVLWAVWKRFFDKKGDMMDIKEGGENVLNAVDGWFQQQEAQLDVALKVANVAADVVDKGKSDTEDGKDGKQDPKAMLGLFGEGLKAFSGVRKAAREKASEGLDAFVSENDENPPVALTVVLIFTLLASFSNNNYK